MRAALSLELSGAPRRARLSPTKPAKLPSSPRAACRVLLRLERRDADMHRWHRLAGAATGAPSSRRPGPERRSMRMIRPDPLILVALPVDAVVVLEQQE